MSRSIDQFTTPFSPAEAFCIGGIISACDVHTNETGTSIWVLPVIHNPQKATPESLSAHKKHLENVFAEIPTITVSKGESDFTKYMQPNKDGFVFLFVSKDLNTPEILIQRFANDILSSEESIRCAFISGVFDGRSSWDKSGKMITLDSRNELCAKTICSILDSLSIRYNYNPPRERASGNPRKAQLRIYSTDVPDFIKRIGLISPTRIKDIENASICNFSEEFDTILDGLTRVMGLRTSTQTREYKKITREEFSIESELDRKLLDDVVNEIDSDIPEKPTYKGAPKKKKAPTKVSSSETYPRDTNTALNALKIAEYKCEIDSEHPTFIRKKNNLPYTEPHHLIPMAYSDNFDFSLDVEENIVSLCSNCHNQIHYGKDVEVILQPLYEKRKDLLARAGIYIAYAELLEMYK